MKKFTKYLVTIINEIIEDLQDIHKNTFYDNIENIHRRNPMLKKKMNLGLCFTSTASIEKIIRKSKLRYIKILVTEKKFLSSKKK